MKIFGSAQSVTTLLDHHQKYLVCQQLQQQLVHGNHVFAEVVYQGISESVKVEVENLHVG